MYKAFESGGRGTLLFSPYVGSGPASTVHPKINIRNFKKYRRFRTLSLRKDPKMLRNDPCIAQFCDNPRKYPQNLHTQKNIHFLKTPKNIRIQNFEPQKIACAYVCVKISGVPRWGSSV